MKIFITPFFIIISHFLYAQEEILSQDDVIKKSMYFGGGSFFIDDEQKEELSIFLREIKNINTYEVIIFSHTDNIGGIEYNKWLSMMRREAVIDQLIINGIPKEVPKVRDFGQSNPLYTNRSVGGRMMNRRVDVILVPIVF